MFRSFIVRKLESLLKDKFDELESTVEECESSCSKACDDLEQQLDDLSEEVQGMNNIDEDGVATIIEEHEIAENVSDHEERIDELEDEIKQLRQLLIELGIIVADKQEVSH